MGIEGDVDAWLRLCFFPFLTPWLGLSLPGICNPAALPPAPPSLQERLAQCQDQSSRHAAELRDFKNKMLPLLEVAEKEREALRTEADTISGRVDRLEREVDYLETQNPALPCVEVEEKVSGGPGTKGKGRRNEKYDMMTGKQSESRPLTLSEPVFFLGLFPFSPCPSPPWLYPLSSGIYFRESSVMTGPLRKVSGDPGRCDTLFPNLP